MKQIVLTVGIALITSVSFGQKSQVVNAVMAYNDFHDHASDMEQATKDINEAKQFIDAAAAHSDTKDDPKAMLYKGKIYMEIAAMAQIAEDKSKFPGVDPEKTAEDGMAALKRVNGLDSKGKYKEDLAQYAGLYHATLSNAGITAYGEENYEMAMQGLLGAAMFGEIMGIQDSAMYFYGGQAAYLAKDWEEAENAFKKCVELNYNVGESTGLLADVLKSQDKKAEAEKVLTDAVQKHPEDLGLLIRMTNFYIDDNRNEDAEKALSAAIKLDPSNTALIYTSGIIYETMGRLEEAEAAYRKTLELDPKHNDAKYSLGVFFFNRGADANNIANGLEFGDPTYDQRVAESKAFFEQSLPFLEQASAAAPDDIIILESLKAVYGKLSMTDKFMETKERINKLKEG